MSPSASALLTIELDLWLLDKEPARFTDAAVLADAYKRSPLLQHCPLAWRTSCASMTTRAARCGAMR